MLVYRTKRFVVRPASEATDISYFHKQTRGLASLKFNIRNCGDVVNVFMQTIKKGAFTNSVDPDDTPQNAASHQGLR